MRKAVRVLGVVIMAPFALLANVGGHAVFISVAQALSLIPGVVGRTLRRGYYHLTLDEFPLSSRVGFGSFFRGKHVTVGENVLISSHCTIWENVAIGNRALISDGARITSGRKQHPIADGKRSMEGQAERITIGRDVWIGTAAVVMASVGHGAQVGAGSVVVHEVYAESTVVGNPARPTHIPETRKAVYR